MWTSAKIRHHISDIPDGQTFATREFLGYGTRDAVDKAIQRLVKGQVIVRVARGVFLKTLIVEGVLQLPSLAQIVLTKAQAFGKQILVHGNDAAYALGIATTKNEEPTFTASGSSSSFICLDPDLGEVRVHFRSCSPLAKKFGDTPIGLIFRGMRSLPKDLRTCDALNLATEVCNFGRIERKEFLDSAKWMPSWLSRLILAVSLPNETTQTMVAATAASGTAVSPSWEFLKKHMTEEEYSDFAKRELKTWIPPWIEFPPAPQPDWNLLSKTKSKSKSESKPKPKPS